MSALRAKLKVTEVLLSKDGDGNISQERVKLAAVYSSDPDNENHQWSKWTPNATFEMWINNPNAFGKLSNGHEFYVDFIPCETADAATT
jgi:hypothetical protein